MPQTKVRCVKGDCRHSGFCGSDSSDLKPLADSCLAQAKMAYLWATDNPNVEFKNPADVSTGEYGDSDLNDEWFWASAELYITTGRREYESRAIAHNSDFNVPSWGEVGMLGHYSLVNSNTEITKVNSQAQVIDKANGLTRADAHSPIRLSLSNYDWGSNSSVANEAMLKLIAYRLTGCNRFKASALNDLHYLLGRNGTGFCYLTGFGSHNPKNIHHRISAADGIDEPVPGLLVGGPNTVVMTDCDDTERSKYPAKSYADKLCSYSTNEIAINWNAPMAFLLWGIASN